MIKSTYSYSYELSNLIQWNCSYKHEKLNLTQHNLKNMVCTNQYIMIFYRNPLEPKASHTIYTV